MGCWAHARRKFIETLKIIPKENRKGSNTEKGFLLINELFRLESEFKDLSFEERHKKRVSESIKTAEELFAWVKTFEFTKLPKSLFKTAIGYLISQEKYLMNVFKDGRLEFSNNRAERNIKPFVIGRKNWLFCTSQKGAHTSAAIYSLIETAKENNLSPYKYIKFLLENIPDAKNSELINFMPWAQFAKDNCQVFCNLRLPLIL